MAQSTGQSFLGYLESQRRGLTGDRHATRTRELSAEHGYDTKYALHALRIAHQGRQLLREGTITLPMPEPVRSELLRVRRGELPFAEVLERLDSETEALKTEMNAADLPEVPDRERVDRFLVSAYRRAWG